MRRTKLRGRTVAEKDMQRNVADRYEALVGLGGQLGACFTPSHYSQLTLSQFAMRISQQTQESSHAD